MPTDLLREDTSIHDTQATDTVHAAVQVDHAVSRGRAHACSAHGMVQREGLLVHVVLELLVGDLVDVAAGVRPPVRGLVVVGGDGLQELLEGWAAHDLKADTQARHENLTVVVFFVAEVFGIDNCCLR